ncbi:39S ribosomal protein L51, mitochondrial [Trichinella nelsoni]|uniref:Large ribosomal subunit protein mL51 n=1 Tax=Trichinella nelsoni TaxID=6336 RepID=A0A0V0RL60_9BILA|nr:39S ribosomal protein L51, mitochondrial [Trichinella nelsoni]
MNYSLVHLPLLYSPIPCSAISASYFLLCNVYKACAHMGGFASPPARPGTKTIYDNSHVPRVIKDRTRIPLKVNDYGFYWNYYQNGQRLPRIKDCMTPVRMPTFELKDNWCKEKALYGQNDYIDLLGDGSVHPAQLLYHVPPWLRGFPGQHRANELIKLIHYRNLYKEKMKRNTPKRWHELCKRIRYLLKYHNYKKQDELKIERDLGLWEEKPDFYYKDKTRRSYLDDP